MHLNGKVQCLLDRLNMAQDLNDIKFIHAYPFAKKATILSCVVACVCAGDIKLDSVSVTNESYFGTYDLVIRLFVPFGLDGKLVNQIMEKIINVAVDNTTIGLKIDSIKKDTPTNCYIEKCTITYNGTLCKEDIDGWKNRGSQRWCGIF